MRSLYRTYCVPFEPSRHTLSQELGRFFGFYFGVVWDDLLRLGDMEVGNVVAGDLADRIATKGVKRHAFVGVLFAAVRTGDYRYIGG